MSVQECIDIVRVEVYDRKSEVISMYENTKNTDESVVEKPNEDTKEFRMKFIPTDEKEDEEELKKTEIEKGNELQENYEKKQELRLEEDEQIKLEDEERWENEQKQRDEEQQEREEEYKEKADENDEEKEENADHDDQSEVESDENDQHMYSPEGVTRENRKAKLVKILQPRSRMRFKMKKDDETIEDSINHDARKTKFTSLATPPVAPRRSRQNSACSTQSSVRYASFMPPPSVSIRRRRVVESILLYVQRKTKLFEKIVDMVRLSENPTMHDLGLEFLRVYDGRFHYREGHTFEMSFREKTWLLTIEQITYVDCAAGEVGPRSLLKLNYKGQTATVHV